MHRGALRLGAFLWTMTPCVSVLAHGEAPAAYSVLSHDAQGARAVRLSAGVALRRAAQRFQFVCPSAWGDQYAAPVAALADGTLVVDSTSGLKLLHEDGTVEVHPDPAAAGDSSDVVRAARGVFSLRTTQAGSELLAVDAQTVRVLWQDAKTLYSLAPLDDKLVLLRASGSTIEQVMVAAADGTELDRQVAAVGSPVDYVFARASAGAAYALVVFRTTSALGNLRMNAFTKIAEAELTIAGPLSVGESTLIALDGELSQLVEALPTPLADAGTVLCLEQNEGLAYACNPEGIARVTGLSLGEPLFQWSWLVAPDLEALATGEPRDRCNAQWQDLRVDLLAAGISLPPDAAPVMMDAGSALVDAAIADDVTEARAPGDVDSGQAGVEAPHVKESARCGALPWRSRACAVSLAGPVFVLLLLRRRRGRAHTNRSAADL